MRQRYLTEGADRVAILAIILAVLAALGGIGTVFLWLDSRSERSRKKRNDEVDHRLAEALAPIHQELSAMRGDFKSAMHEAMEPVKVQVAELNTKIEIPWRTLEQLAITNAIDLHKPHPGAERIDALLDAFIAYSRGEGPFSADDELALRHFLTIIRNWKPGQDVGFPVEDGDPTRAAIVLTTMELIRIRRKQEQKK